MTMTYAPAEVFPPGEYLRDELEERGWSVTEFAEIIGRPVQAVSEILNAKKEITTETALALSDALGTSPELWLNLQTSYRLFQHRSNSESTATATPVARRARLRRLLPLAEVRARGWIPDTSDLDVVEDSVLHLLEINTFDERPRFAMAARRANSAEPITVEQTAWLAHVRSVAAGRDADRFDRTRLAALAEHLPRALRDGPGNLLEVPSLLATCGVVVVFSEGLRGGKLDGAVTLLGDDRPVIGLTTRGDRFDGVLFTLLHECAHLVLDHITSNEAAIVDADVMDEQTDPPEKTANEQAMQWLFPDGFQVDSASVPAIVAAADRYQVHPSVVIGQIQRQTGDWKKYRARVPKVRSFLAQSGALS